MVWRVGLRWLPPCVWPELGSDALAGQVRLRRELDAQAQQHAAELRASEERHKADLTAVQELVRGPARLGSGRFVRIVEALASLEVSGALLGG